MLDSDIILGIRGNLGCGTYEHGIVTQNTDGWPCGVPIVYPEGHLDLKNGSLAVQTLMTPAQNCAGLEVMNVLGSNVVPVGFKLLCKTHKVLEVSEFDPGKFDRLIEFVRDVGGISLVIGNTKGREAATKSVFKFADGWKHASVFYYNGWGSKPLEGEDDNYLCVLNFLDLPYCIPLFNMRKVDGIGLSFSGALRKASEKYGRLERIFRTDLVLTNYSDNVFVIDGVEINQRAPLTRDHYKQLKEMAGQELQVLQIPKTKKKKSKSRDGKWEHRAVGYGYNYPEEKMKWKAEHQTISVEVGNVNQAQFVVSTDEPQSPQEAGESIHKMYGTSTGHIIFGEPSSTLEFSEEVESPPDDEPEEANESPPEGFDSWEDWENAQDPEGN